MVNNSKTFGVHLQALAGSSSSSISQLKSSSSSAALSRFRKSALVALPL
uniref:Uncharacterized protein n=1 Tax=Rhizophora mucronata TaxID=61149 RepID=A0A2P2R141_RHIMU